MTTEHPTPPIWCIMPVLGARDYTVTAIADLLAQTLPVKILVVNQGVDDDFRDELERIAEAHPERVFVWHHVPPLPSLAATWNRALDFVWAVGGEVALVVNNDVRVPRQLVEILAKVQRRTDALFVSAVGVREPDYQPARIYTADEIARLTWADDEGCGYPVAPGGPDFSCFLIAFACHDNYRFDEGFVPAYCEDLDYHRRVLLAGAGHRIFSVNIPYLHYASGTLKAMDPARKAAIEAAITRGSRARYQAKWGGPVNQETLVHPFGAVATADDVTTPTLQARLHWPSPPTDPAADTDVDVDEPEVLL
jgi:GT2 family glycosyltransferase